MKIIGRDYTKPKEGVYAALTGQLRFVEREVSQPMLQYGKDILAIRMLKILQQEWAIIEDDGKGNRKQYFQWRDVPTATEETEQ